MNTTIYNSPICHIALSRLFMIFTKLTCSLTTAVLCLTLIVIIINIISRSRTIKYAGTVMIFYV